MVKKEGTEQKSNMYILAIVGIVAMVGIVVLLSNTGMTGTSDFSGAATTTLCTETDSGLDYLTKGSVYGGTWKFGGATYTKKVDSCKDSINLFEYYCSSSTQAFYTTKSCTTSVGTGSVCRDGACTAVFVDSDGDGVADSSDDCPGYDDTVDTNGNEIPDGCDALIDSDGDGVSNADEIAAGTDPLDWDDYPGR